MPYEVKRLLLWLEYHPLVKSYARGDIGPQFATMTEKRWSATGKTDWDVVGGEMMNSKNSGMSKFTTP